VPVAEANGQRLYYEVHGEGEPLLLVMGLAADTLSWVLQIPAWSQRFRTIAFDNRDVGRSSYAESEYEIGDMAADALALADALDLDTFHLVGVSMGGAIAQHMALAAPERIRTLQLCVTYARAGNWGRKLADVWGAQAMRASREEHIDHLMLLCFTDGFYEHPEAVANARELMLANPHPQDPEGFVRQLRASGRHDALDRLGELSMPVHVIGAEHDILVPVWKSAEIAERVPGARYSVIEGAAHGINLEFPEEFNRLVLEFVEEHAAATAA
jgi:3-oxoadipate enol-lactonase